VSCFLRIHSYVQPQLHGTFPVAGLNDAESLETVLDASETDCVILRDCRGGEDLQRFDMLLSVAEARLRLAEGRIRIIASAVDSALGYTRLGSLCGKSARLVGLTWNPTAFAADIGCDLAAATVELARLHLVIAARAAGVLAYDSASGAVVKASDAFIEQSRALGYDGVALPA
jgi:citrate lyase beta subunit